MIYPQDNLDEEQAQKIKPFVTNLDKPVFALTNLPETTKGALFARYSRFPGTLRELLATEFIDDLPEVKEDLTSEQARTAQLYNTIFLGYGDDSVAQLGGAHIALEWSSNILTKILQRPRIASYLEQSTRYINFANKVDINNENNYRFYQNSHLGEAYQKNMTNIFNIYTDLYNKMLIEIKQQFPQGNQPQAAWDRACKAKTLDLIRGLLPASTLSHMGMYATGQTYEGLIMRLLASELREANDYGLMMLEELNKVIPAFLTRIQRPERGGRWMEFMKEQKEVAVNISSSLNINSSKQNATVDLLEVKGKEKEVLSALLYESNNYSNMELDNYVNNLNNEESSKLFKQFADLRKSDDANRRWKINRGLERISYRFEIVSDYGAFRDLQRHRMLSLQWQTLTPYLGYEIPIEVIDAGYEKEYNQAIELSAETYELLLKEHNSLQASYALSLAYKMRYIFDLNLREAIHLIELRSGIEGHPSYRAVAISMYEQILKATPQLAEFFNFVDTSSDARLERLLSEIRTQQKIDSKKH